MNESPHVARRPGRQCTTMDRCLARHARLVDKSTLLPTPPAPMHCITNATPCYRGERPTLLLGRESAWQSPPRRIQSGREGTLLWERRGRKTHRRPSPCARATAGAGHSPSSSTRLGGRSQHRRQRWCDRRTQQPPRTKHMG